MKNKFLKMLMSAALGTTLGLVFTGVMPAMAADVSSNTITQQVTEISSNETNEEDTTGNVSVEPSSSSLENSTVQEAENNNTDGEKNNISTSGVSEESTAESNDVSDPAEETAPEEEQSSESVSSDIKSTETSNDTQVKDDEKKEEKNTGKDWYRITLKDIVIQLIIAFIIFVIPGYWICFVRNKR